LPLLGPGFASVSFPVTACLNMLRHIRRLAPDILIDTSQWANLGAVLALLSGARCTIGFDTPGQYRGEAYAFRVPHRNDRHEVENFLALGRILDPGMNAGPRLFIPGSPARPENFAAYPPLNQIVYLHMFASGLYPHMKEWAPESWRDLALACQAAGYRVYFTGAAKDQARAAAFLRDYIPVHLRGRQTITSIAGLVSLSDLAWLFRRSAGVVSVNTGILHLASLCGAPTVDLHGPTNPRRWGGIGPQVISLLAPGPDTAYLNLGFEHPPGSVPSLGRLSAADVLAALRQLKLKV
jgi:ADP-heptose:LPS heptosyltransferase